MGRWHPKSSPCSAGTATLVGERWPGDGQPVVLLHAGRGRPAVLVRRRRCALAATGAVAYDMRGYGETSGVTYGFSHLDDLDAVLDQVASGPVWLVGSSMGGELAIDAALAVAGACGRPGAARPGGERRS